MAGGHSPSMAGGQGFAPQQGGPSTGQQALPPQGYGATGGAQPHPAFAQQPQEPARRGSPLVPILVAVVALLLVAGGAGYYFVRVRGAVTPVAVDPAEPSGDEAPPEPGPESPPPVADPANAATEAPPETTPEPEADAEPVASASAEPEPEPEPPPTAAPDPPANPTPAANNPPPANPPPANPPPAAANPPANPAPANNPTPAAWAPPPAVPKPAADPNAFNESAAKTSLGHQNGVLVVCRKGKVGGPGTALVTFVESGAVSNVTLNPPYQGTDEGECAAKYFRRAKVNPFTGGPKTVRHAFEVPK